MNTIELFFLNLGLNWTLAKLLPYVLTVLLGLLLSRPVYKKMFSTKKILKTIFSVLVFVLPFSGYFAYSPIYQGDFSNEAHETVLTTDLDEIKGKELIVLALPGCPFCAQSMAKSAKLIERNPGLKITYIVIKADQQALDWYRKMASNGIVVQAAKQDKALSTLAKGKFPTFVLVQANTVRAWSNDGFGVRAIDEVENLF